MTGLGYRGARRSPQTARSLKGTMRYCLCSSPRSKSHYPWHRSASLFAPVGRVEQLLSDWVRLSRGKALAANGKVFEGRASQFGGESDWVFASPQKAGELPLRSTAMLEKQIKPAAEAAKLEGSIGWHTFRHSYS